MVKKAVVFTGGGTAGHIFPGLAIAEELKKIWPGDVYWLGTLIRSERRWVSEAGIRFRGIYSGKMRRYFSLQNVTDLVKIFMGFVQAYFFLRRLRPSLVFSKGGYVSFPPVVAARLLGIPSYTHESDYDPGFATRLNSRFCEKILVSYPDTTRYFGAAYRRRIMVTGNPVRPFIKSGSREQGRRLLGSRLPVLLVLGGSLGAREINNYIYAVLDSLASRYFVVHQTGPAHLLPSGLVPQANYLALPFIGREYPHLLAAADLVISRCGANTLAELSCAGKPAILIPLSLRGSRGDQVRNAAYLEKLAAGVIFRGSSGRELLELIDKVMNNKQKLQQLSARIKNTAATDAAAGIANLIKERIK